MYVNNFLVTSLEGYKNVLVLGFQHIVSLLFVSIFHKSYPSSI